MTIANELVDHIKFGSGIITEVKENIIYVQFQDPVGKKAFIFPDAFESFLKAINQTLEDDVHEALRAKKEQIEKEMERKRIEREAAEAEENLRKLELTKKKAVTRTRKKSS